MSLADFLQAKLGEHSTENVNYLINYYIIFLYIKIR
jgi:hypothetical protein